MTHVHGHSEFTDHHHKDDEEKKWLEIDRLYQNKSTEEKVVIEWFTQNVDKYLNSNVPHDTFSIVSFSCGDGRKDQMALRAIMPALKAKSKTVFYCGVDPDDTAIERFRKSVSECTDQNLRDVNFDLVVQTYESYVQGTAKLKDCACENKANLILFVDSLCHLTLGPEEVLLHCYEHELSPQGVIVILLWNAEDFWFKIRERLSDANVGAPTAHENNDYLTIQDVKKVVEKHNWRFNMYAPDYSLDVSECFKADSEEGKIMMECLACYSNSQASTTDDASRDKLLEFLRRETVLNESSRVLKGNLGILVIYK